MTRRMLIVSSTAAAIGLMLIFASVFRHRSSQAAPPQRTDFETAVDLAPMGSLAVFEEGRLKSFESFASSMMHLVSGGRPIAGHTDGFVYLDLMLRPQAYEDTATIYVKSKPLRQEMVAALRRSLEETLPPRLAEMTAAGQLSDADADTRAAEVRREFEWSMVRFVDTGMLTEQMVLDPRVQDLLDVKERDLIRTAKSVRQVRTALAVRDPQVLWQSLRLVPPPAAGDDVSKQPWTTIDVYMRQAGGDPDESERAGHIGATWDALAAGWIAEDAAAVNAAVVQLAALLPAVNPGIYPEQRKLSMETWYFQAGNMTWVWLIYLLSVIFLLMSVVYRWPAARYLGLATFAVAFGFHTFAIMLRWYVSGRWPNANMFEAVTTSAWFGGCMAMVMELLVRNTPMRNLFALGSAVASMVAMMCVRFMPVELNPNISNKMPVLHDVWLYIHTNVIIFSYVLITMAAVSATIYVIYRLGGGQADFARAGGAGALLQRRPDGERYFTDTRTSPGQVFDGATMVLMELAFILLWAGLVMGAIWADHSWGRPWGWDPKEVFALNTFIILALLIHVRLKVRDKGLWTALLAIAGFIVMMFNWIFINFVIVGLHSYA